MKVLIVDDNPMDLSVANDFVSKLGYETVSDALYHHYDRLNVRS